MSDSSVFNNVCAAVKPTHRINFGLINSICLIRYGSHCSTSSGFGLRLSGGRHFKIFAIYTSSRLNWIASRIFVSNCPARPTNGIPCASSSAPGASPITIRSALGLPTPKTNFVRVFPRPHFKQLQICLFRSTISEAELHDSITGDFFTGGVSIFFLTAIRGSGLSAFSIIAALDGLVTVFSRYNVLPNSARSCFKNVCASVKNFSISDSGIDNILVFFLS